MTSPRRGCEIDDCDRAHFARGWCQKHYDRWYHHGNPHWTPQKPVPPQFFTLPVHPGNPWWKPDNDPCPGCGSNLWWLPYDPTRDGTVWHCVDCGTWAAA